VPVS
jgi:hypothetical protein